ncbi:MAG: MCP four helix bundle domain-containing protein [Sterolibacterium sp.]|nr:MCP four helix bundle domain-containing protein [Sterolibacterium sp.]
MFKNLRIGTRLGIAFAFVLVMMSIIAALGIVRMSSLNDDIHLIVNDRAVKVKQANDVIDALNIIARRMRNSLLEKEADNIRRELDDIPAQRKIVGDILEVLHTSITLDKGKEILKQIDDNRAIYIPLQNKFIDLVNAGKREEATEFMLGTINQTQGAYLKSVNDLIIFQTELMQEAGRNATNAYEQGRMVMFTVSLIALIVSILFGFWITRSITRPVAQAAHAANELAEGNLMVRVESSSRDEIGQMMASIQSMITKLTSIISEVNVSADTLNTAAGQVSVTAQTLSEGASEQAASVEETTASVEQMTASITQNTENATVTDSMATSAAKQAEEGGIAVKETVEAMKQIAGRIGIIDDIAYQTNLLALNAAIEAARAGEHGKGFAVVAAEVRKLAERSQVAAQEIGELAGSSVTMAEKAGKLLDEMVPSIRKTSDLVQEIAAASQEQSSSVGQINMAMGQLNQATQQNASASEELAATAEEMGGQAGQLQQLMAFFRLEDTAQTAKQRPHAAAATDKAGQRTQAKTKAAAATNSEHGFERF